ncbi:MAG: radical SAM protein [Candidatus Hadarchaeales archaeon]
MVCNREGIVSRILGVCGRCIRERFGEAEPYIREAHRKVRSRYGLPPEVPREPGGLPCTGCGNGCRIGEGGRGFCGVVENRGGKLVRLFGTPERGLLQYYYDALPTNCVPADFCAGSGGAGYPKWCRTPRGDLGYYNLAVFLGSCTYSCLYCQNFSFRELTELGRPIYTASELAGKVGERVSCVCFFGGDPSSQMPFVQASSGLMRERAGERLLRICLETNLDMRWEDLERFAPLSLESGGGIKADLKCWSSELLFAFSGIRHRVAYINFRRLSRMHRKRPEVPFVRASTLLVPGYIDEEEIKCLASFIADLDTSIPYSLLAFHPTYFMDDLPYTRRADAERYLQICRREGLEKVRIGNPWLLA